MALSDKTKRVDFIVSCASASDQDLKDLDRDLADVLAQMGALQYAYILHDLDVRDDGTLKVPHFHIVSEFPSPKRLLTFLNAFCDLTGLNPLAVSVQKCVSFEGSIQYLIHKADPEKHQYSISSVRSNIGADDLALLMESEADSLTIDRLLVLCKELKNPIDVARKIGLGRYQIYRKVIGDCFDYLRVKERAERWKKEHER